MKNTYTITSAKAKLSSIISQVEYNHSKIFITRKGKNIATILPFNEYQKQISKNDGLILAKGALADLDNFDEWICEIYNSRMASTDRKVSI